MEWVETTGRTLADAKEAALDQLGVDETDAEFEVLEEPRSGLFGRLRSEARVRARVRPTTPRPKVERRDRRPRAERGGGERTERAERPSKDAAEDATPAPAKPKRAPRAPRPPAAAPAATKGDPVDDAPDLETVAGDLRGFLEGVLDAFDLEGEVAVATL